MRANFLGFIVFERTGMGFFLSNPDYGQRIQDRFALDFQLSGQVVNSNLTHPPLISSATFR